MRYGYPTGADPQALYAFAARLIDDLNRADGARIDGLRQVSASEIVSGSDYFLEADASSGPIVITLPALTLGRTIVVKKTDATANSVTLIGQIDGEVSFEITEQYYAATVIGGASQWLLI